VTQPCTENDPESYAGEPVDDGFVDPSVDFVNPADTAAIMAIVDAPYRPGLDARFDDEEVTGDGVDSGAVPGQPEV
jgi:hypothetical protein